VRRSSNIYNDFKELTIVVPRHLADWVREVSKTLALTPDQFITKILEMYKTVWDAAIDYTRSIETEESGGKYLDREFLEYFREYLEDKGYSKITIKNYLRVISRFLDWCDENNVAFDQVGEEHIRIFMEERNLKYSTQNVYKYIIHEFLKFIRSLTSLKRIND